MPRTHNNIVLSFTPICSRRGGGWCITNEYEFNGEVRGLKSSLARFRETYFVNTRDSILLHHYVHIFFMFMPSAKILIVKNNISQYPS